MCTNFAKLVDHFFKMFINIFEIGCKIMLSSKRFIIFLLKAFYVHFYNIDVKSSIHDDTTFFRYIK